MIRRKTAKDGVAVTFVLDEDTAAAVSVVGDFNDWTPGLHQLRRRSNGTRSATVTLPTGSTVRFRYLGEGGRWFDEPDADAHDGDASVLRL
jgi:1,4-alpha-glucan branching enzyme